MWKFVSIKTIEGNILSEGYMHNMDNDVLFPIHKDEFESLKEVYNFSFSFEDIKNQEPIGRQIAYCYGNENVIMMTKKEFFKEIN